MIQDCEFFQIHLLDVAGIAISQKQQTRKKIELKQFQKAKPPMFRKKTFPKIPKESFFCGQYCSLFLIPFIELYLN